VLLSIGDTFGEASRGYLLQELSRPYPVLVNGSEQRVLPMSDPRRVQFPAPLRQRDGYLLPFSDQVFFPSTLGARTALARMALDPPWLGRALSILVRTGITSLLARRSGGGPSQRLIRGLQRRYAGHDGYGLVIEVDGPNSAVRASLAGHGQADITALGAAAIARSLIDSQVSQPGIWLAEQIVPPAPFLEHLADNGVGPRLDDVGVPGSYGVLTP
jgi:saccharopine dehydrogenase-like NADP-dependent oxidoreductase